jgi:hypothetical protein
VVGGTELAGPRRLFRPQVPSIDECAIVSRQLFSILYSDGSGGAGVGRRWCWRDRRRRDAETRARKDVQEAKENTQVTPNRSMSEAHGVWVFRGYSNTKGMVSRRSSIKGSDVAVLKKSKEMVVMTSERYRKMNEWLVG